MTVKELIELLKQFNNDDCVMRYDSEIGDVDVIRVEQKDDGWVVIL